MFWHLALNMYEVNKKKKTNSFVLISEEVQMCHFLLLKPREMDRFKFEGKAVLGTILCSLAELLL